MMEWFKAKPMKTKVILGVIAAIVVIGVIQNIAG